MRLLCERAGNLAVLERLHATGMIVHQSDYHHRYPFDWRTKQPVILRATKQWFADLTQTSLDAENALENVEMIPDSARSRLRSMLQSRTDWCTLPREI